MNAPAHAAPPQLAPEATQIGVLTLEMKRAMARLAGSEALARVVRRLPDDRREEFVDVTLFGRCRFGTLNIVIAELSRECGRELDAFTHELVRESFGVVLRTVWRLLARFTTEESIVLRASQLYSRAIDRGRPRAYVQSPGHLVMEITERRDLSHIDIVSIAAAIEATLELSGRRVRVMAQRLPFGVRYDVYVRATLPPTER
jgi:hypothetical protein